MGFEPLSPLLIIWGWCSWVFWRAFACGIGAVACSLTPHRAEKIFHLKTRAAVEGAINVREQQKDPESSGDERQGAETPLHTPHLLRNGCPVCWVHMYCGHLQRYLFLPHLYCCWLSSFKYCSCIWWVTIKSFKDLLIHSSLFCFVLFCGIGNWIQSLHTELHCQLFKFSFYFETLLLRVFGGFFEGSRKFVLFCFCFCFYQELNLGPCICQADPYYCVSKLPRLGFEFLLSFNKILLDSSMHQKVFQVPIKQQWKTKLKNRQKSLPIQSLHSGRGK